MNSQSGIYQSSWKQWVAGLAAASILLHPSGDISWIFGAGNDLANFGFTMASIALVIIGAILGAVLADTFGRKRTLLATLIFVIPRLVSIISEEAEWAWIVQIFIEFGSGITCTVVPLYISEIACNNNRGKLMVLQLLAYSIGAAIVMTVLAFYISFEFDNIVCIIISSILLLISVLFHGIILALFPETPHYLNSKKRYQEAAESLAFFRGMNHVKIREDPSSLPLNSQINGRKRGKISEIMLFENRRSLAIIFTLIVIRWLSGQYGTDVMVSHLLHMSTEISVVNAVLVAYGVKLIFIIFTILAIGVLQRKLTLVFVIIICIIAAIISFPCFHLNYWILLVGFLVQNFGHVILVGVGLAYTGEFFSTNVRAIAIALTISFEILIRNLVLSAEHAIMHNIVFYDEFEHIPLPTYVSSVVFISALFFVLIFFPKTNKVRPNFDIAIETSAGGEYL